MPGTTACMQKVVTNATFVGMRSVLCTAMHVLKTVINSATNMKVKNVVATTDLLMYAIIARTAVIAKMTSIFMTLRSQIRKQPNLKQPQEPVSIFPMKSSEL